ncbi:hypothetical protein EVAR_32548_1 [Eumeta japonica]|uniref:Uncharacterized protein n=1 Tax=Eumeta variegata TaxID=151549 RepID=A0A4C1VTG6_EUMVA|nr:hypothetical protein EVAR_32548_1 [Eumeta japonica]
MGSEFEPDLNQRPSDHAFWFDVLNHSDLVTYQAQCAPAANTFTNRLLKTSSQIANVISPLRGLRCSHINLMSKRGPSRIGRSSDARRRRARRQRAGLQFPHLLVQRGGRLTAPAQFASVGGGGACVVCEFAG